MKPLVLLLPPVLSDAVRDCLERLRSQHFVDRFLARDATLWTGSDEARWMGWLEAVERASAATRELTGFAAAVRAEGIRDVVLLGMGGSSMAPEVIRDTVGTREGCPELRVLDSTDPDQVQAVAAEIDPAATLFVVASKSGSTLEPNVLKDYFFRRAGDAVGEQRAARQFVAITDPGSSLDTEARQLGFRQVFPGVPEIGGRFSALSNFGLVPAALIGVDLDDLLRRAAGMVELCRERDPVANPGVRLGCVLGVAACQGRNKLTLVLSPGLAALGAWLEQLVAESTGKQGQCIIPVDGEPVGSPGEYGNDRLFVYVRLEAGAEATQDAAIAVLQEAGQPVVRIDVQDRLDIGREFFRWEMATAAAAAVLQINPFDQPDVEASKVESRRITAACEAGGALPEQEILAADGTVTLHADSGNAAQLRSRCGAGADMRAYLQALLQLIGPGDYCAILAYLPRSESNLAALQRVRQAIRSGTTAATSLGFGPRFLHSTGQAFKGGSNCGVFFQLTADPVRDLAIPGRSCSFGLVEAAQALGDQAVMAARQRRIVRLHLGADVAGGLARLAAMLAPDRSAG